MKGILFKPQLIPLVLSGQKTMTRRAIKPQPETDSVTWGCIGGQGFGFIFGTKVFKPRYQPGEIVYLKETWGSNMVKGWEKCGKIFYRVDMPDHKTIPETYGRPWRSPLMMPEWASRCKLQILNVKVDRLQEITEEDVISEGCGIQPLHPDDEYIRAIEDFACLWDSINKEYPWSSNPRVFVYEFKPIPSSDEGK